MPAGGGVACVASSSHACAEEYLLAMGRFGEGEAFSLSRGWVSLWSFAAARSARFFVTAYLTGDLRGVPAEWSPMRGSGDSGMVRRASGDLMDAAARRRIGGDVAAAAVFAEAFASPLGSRGKMAGQHAAWGAGGSGIRDEAFGSERARTCSPRHRRVVSCPCARRRCIPRPRPAPTSRRPRGEPSRDVPAILPTV